MLKCIRINMKELFKLFYRIGIYMLALLFIFSSQSLAHSVLKDASPKPGEVIKVDLREISLFFTTKVETSVVELKNDNDEVFTPNILIDNDIVKGTLETPLPNGKYILNWSIIGADGHLIKNKYEFEVAVPIRTPAQTPEPIQQTKPEKPKTEEQAKVELTKPLENNSKPPEENGSSSLVTLIVMLVALLGIGSLIWLMRRKA